MTSNSVWRVPSSFGHCSACWGAADLNLTHCKAYICDLIPNIAQNIVSKFKSKHVFSHIRNLNSTIYNLKQKFLVGQNIGSKLKSKHIQSRAPCRALLQAIFSIPVLTVASSSLWLGVISVQRCSVNPASSAGLGSWPGNSTQTSVLYHTCNTDAQPSL